jgi:4-hydroxy-2-oxoheptanedioate aldolase
MTEPVIGKLSRLLANGGSALTGWIGANDPGLAELFAREAFDVVTLDMQHGLLDFAGATRSIQSVAIAGKPAIVRIPVGDFALASRLVDAGASGVIAPFINNAEDARRFVDFVKFPPVGQRSWGPRAALTFSGLDDAGYLKGANALIQAIAMIETRSALDALDDILGVPGVDGVFVGPFDLSIALNNGAGAEPRGETTMKAARHIVERAKAHGKYAAMFCYDGADARAMLKLGFQLCTVGRDQTLMRTVIRSELAAARG